jgi:hypothetical protein
MFGTERTEPFHSLGLLQQQNNWKCVAFRIIRYNILLAVAAFKPLSKEKGVILERWFLWILCASIPVENKMNVFNIQSG